jgi:hypothetical protein
MNAPLRSWLRQLLQSFSDTNHEALGLLPFQNAQVGQRVFHCSSFVARNSGVTQGTRINGVLSRFHPNLKLLRVELKQRGFV